MRGEIATLHREISRGTGALISLAVTLFLSLPGAMTDGFACMKTLREETGKRWTKRNLRYVDCGRFLTSRRTFRDSCGCAIE